MNNEIYQLVSNLKHTIKRDDVYTSFNNTLTSLNNEVIPALADFSKLVKGISIKMSELPELTMLNSMSGIKASDLKSFIKILEKTIVTLSKEGKDVSKLITDSLPEIISRDIISTKQAAILSLINSYGSITLFTIDLLLFLTDRIDVNVNGIVSDLIKSKVMEIKTGMLPYSKLILFFNTNKSLIKDIGKLPNDRIMPDSKDTATFSIASKTKGVLPLMGFIGNPIYHIRMWLVDLEMVKYDALTDKRKLLELKVNDLKSRQGGDNNAKLKKTISYYEDKLEKVEYKIRTIEDE